MKKSKIYGSHVRQIILYGSYARGDFRPDSDIDIMILVDMSDIELKSYGEKLSYMTYDFNLDHDIDIKPIAKSEEIFNKWVVNYPFYSNIHKEGLYYMEQHDVEIGTRRDLVLYRIETSKNDLKSAKVLLSIDDYKGANNRAYYAIFHAINAVHATSGKAYKRHKDAIANFNKDYVKTEIFPREIGRKIGMAEEIRHASDYDDFYIASREEAERQITVAEEFINLVEKYCEKQLD